MLEKSQDNLEPEDIQTNIYTVGKENGYKENLRDWFKLIYEVVFGVENGPRLGFFISFFGIKNTIKLIKEGDPPSKAIDYNAKPTVENLNQFVNTVL